MHLWAPGNGIGFLLLFSFFPSSHNIAAKLARNAANGRAWDRRFHDPLLLRLSIGSFAFNVDDDVL